MGSMFIFIVLAFLCFNVGGITVISSVNEVFALGNPNTSIFNTRNITEANLNLTNIEGDVNITAEYRERFNPANSTETGFIEDVIQYVDEFDFSNIAEPHRVTGLFDDIFITNQIDTLLDTVGFEFAPGFIDGIGIIITFLAMFWFLFLVLNRTTF